MNYDIELNANDSSVLETQYAFTQGDYGQIQFSIRVKADGAYVTNAQRAYIVFTLPNGYVVTGADMSKSVATYTYPFQGSELQVPGTILADVKLVYTDGQISSNKFSFICRYDPLHDKSFYAGPYISKLEQIYAEAQAQADYLRALIEMLQNDISGTPVMRSDLHNTRDAVTAGLKAIDANMAQNILLRSDITNQFEDDTSKISGAASVFALQETVNEISNNAESDYKESVTLCNSVSGTIVLSESIYNFKSLKLANDNDGVQYVSVSQGTNSIKIHTIGMVGNIMVLNVAKWNVSTDGLTLTPQVLTQANLEASGVSYFSTSQTALLWTITGFRK